MSVELDWEIEDVETPLLDTAPEVERHFGGCRRRLSLLALAALVLIGGLGFLWFRVQQKEKESESELRAAVELELAALIDGDRDLFLNRQDPDDRRWRRVQESVFDNYHSVAGRSPWEERPQVLRYTGQVPAVRMQGDEAWAQVEIERGDRAWRELWFYQWTQDAGWRHVPFDENWLGEEQALVTTHLRLSFPMRDEAIVSALARKMEAWYDVIAPLYGVRPTSATVLTVEFAYRSSRSTTPQPFWVRGSSTIEAPSPHQGALSGDASPNATLQRQMAGYLAEALIAHQTGLHPTADLEPEVKALRGELQEWATARIAENVPDQTEWTTLPTPLLDALVARDGVQVNAELIGSLSRARSLEQALAAAGVDPPDPLVRLAFHVAAVNRAVHELDRSSFNDLLDPQADVAWRRNQLNELEWRQRTAQSGEVWPAPAALQVESVVFNGPIAWVEAEMTTSDGAIYRRTYFFRQVDGQWLLTAPDPAYFGERRVTRTENLVFEYFEREAEWFEEEIPTKLQSVLSQAAADLGLPTAGFVITFETEIESGIEGPGPFASPTIAGWRVDRLDDRIPQMALLLLGRLLENSVQISADENLRYRMAYVGAFVWELERLFPEQIDWEAWVGVDIKQVPALTLADLWAERAFDSDEGDLQQLFSIYRALFEFLAETYGLEVVPSLLDNLPQTDSLDEWLLLSTGHGLDEVEPAWQAWVSATYGEQ